MNVIWIVADTFRQDHLGAYGKAEIRTPALDALAARSTRFERHYAAGFPTMPTRADHATGRWTMSFMGWEPIPDEASTLAQMLAGEGVHTAAMVDTPFYLRGGMNYDKGFQTFSMYTGQEGSVTRLIEAHRHESRDAREAWRFEADRNVAQTMTRAMEWLQLHYKEDFFLYVDTWDPHEPWDAPSYYTEMYMPGYDGEVVQPIYGRWQDSPGFTEQRVRKALATYKGEVTMVDTWVGHLLRTVENMGLMENTAIVFTSDHGFYFGEHGGQFGKMTFAKQPDGYLYGHGDPNARWDFSPLYEEIVLVPLLVYVPGASPGVYRGLTSAIDVMPTVLDVMGKAIPGYVEGVSLLPKIHDPSLPGPRLHRVDGALRQPRRLGGLGRQHQAAAGHGAGHHRVDRRVVAALQHRRGDVAAIPPALGPRPAGRRHRRQPGRRQVRARATGQVHVRHQPPGAAT